MVLFSFALSSLKPPGAKNLHHGEGTGRAASRIWQENGQPSHVNDSEYSRKNPLHGQTIELRVYCEFSKIGDPHQLLSWGYSVFIHGLVSWHSSVLQNQYISRAGWWVTHQMWSATLICWVAIVHQHIFSFEFPNISQQFVHHQSFIPSHSYSPVN